MSLTVDITKQLASFNLEVSFDMEKETLGLLGASGCGKSMTLRCIAGVETPDEGKIVVNGTTFYDSSAQINLSPQKRKTALLFQNFQLFPNFSVKQNIAAGLDAGLNADERNRIISQQLARFDLEGFEKRYPLRLSGGQQQRVALARMLAAQPGILMLDEPFSALDSHLKTQLEQDLLDLFDTFDGSILYVSHDIDEAFRFCDHIAVMDQGHLCEIDDTDSIVRHPQTLATLKISSCENTSRARKVDNYTFEALDWGVRLTSASFVPDNLAFIGIRSFFLSAATTQSFNVIDCHIERISDSRFERTVVVEARSSTLAPAGKIQWKIDKLKVPEGHLPGKGEDVSIFFDPHNIYMVCE